MKAVQFVPYKRRQGSNSQDTFWNVPAVDEIVEYVKDEKGNLTDQKRNRTIRYVPGESSIYKDEQSKDAKIGNITVHGNTLWVNENQANKLEYLKLCNYNVSNPLRRTDVNPLIREYDVNKEYRKQVDKDRLELDAQVKARDMDLNELKAYLLVISDSPGSIDRINRMEPDAIRHQANAVAKSNPKKFLDGISDINNKNKLIVMQAIAGNYVRYSEQANTLSWDSGIEILRAPRGIKVLDYFLERAKVEADYNDILDMMKDKMRTVDDKNSLIKVGKPLDMFAQAVDSASRAEIVEKKGMYYHYKDEKYQGIKKFIEALKADKMALFHTLLLEMEAVEETEAAESED